MHRVSCYITYKASIKRLRSLLAGGTPFTGLFSVLHCGGKSLASQTTRTWVCVDSGVWKCKRCKSKSTPCPCVQLVTDWLDYEFLSDDDRSPADPDVDGEEAPAAAAREPRTYDWARPASLSERNPSR